MTDDTLDNIKQYKRCSMCKELKLVSEFTKDKNSKDGLDFRCRQCKKVINDSLKEYKKRHYVENKEHYIKRAKDYNIKHKDEIKQKQLAHRKENLVKYKQYNDAHKEQRKQYKQEHKEHIREYNKKYNKQYKEKHKEWVKQHSESIQRYKQKKQTKDAFKLRVCSCVSTALKANKTANLSAVGIIWYTLEDLKQHLESQFTPEMNWSNYGEYWELDHIIPQNLFNFKSMNDIDFQICWSLNNLRPLTRKENRSRPRDGSDVSEDLKNKILGCDNYELCQK